MLLFDPSNPLDKLTQSAASKARDRFRQLNHRVVDEHMFVASSRVEHKERGPNRISAFGHICQPLANNPNDLLSLAAVLIDVAQIRREIIGQID